MRNSKDVLKALNFRLRGLREAHKSLFKQDKTSRITQEFATRIDEIESMRRWIKRRKGKDNGQARRRIRQS